MDGIKWELIHIPTDPLPPQAPAPALSFLPSTARACIYISCTASFARVNAGIFPMLLGSCSPRHPTSLIPDSSPSNIPNPRFLPRLEAPCCAHSTPAPTHACSDTERGMWHHQLLHNQILPGIFLLVILYFPHFVNNMSSVMQGVTAITGVGLQGK